MRWLRWLLDAAGGGAPPGATPVPAAGKASSWSSIGTDLAYASSSASLACYSWETSLSTTCRCVFGTSNVDLMDAFSSASLTCRQNKKGTCWSLIAAQNQSCLCEARN